MKRIDESGCIYKLDYSGVIRLNGLELHLSRWIFSETVLRQKNQAVKGKADYYAAYFVTSHQGEGGRGIGLRFGRGLPPYL